MKALWHRCVQWCADDLSSVWRRVELSLLCTTHVLNMQHNKLWTEKRHDYVSDSKGKMCVAPLQSRISDTVRVVPVLVAMRYNIHEIMVNLSAFLWNSPKCLIVHYHGCFNWFPELWVLNLAWLMWLISRSLVVLKPVVAASLRSALFFFRPDRDIKPLN